MLPLFLMYYFLILFKCSYKKVMSFVNVFITFFFFCILTNIISSITRAKYHKLKYGTELNQGEVKMPSFESGKRIQPTFENVYIHYFSKVLPLNFLMLLWMSVYRFCSRFTDVFFFVVVSLFLKEDTKETEVSAIPQNSQLTWKQGRQLLRQ